MDRLNAERETELRDWASRDLGSVSSAARELFVEIDALRDEIADLQTEVQTLKFDRDSVRTERDVLLRRVGRLENAATSVHQS